MNFRASGLRLFAVLIVGAALFACALPAKDWKTLKPTGYVSDFAGVIDPASKSALEAYSARVEQATGAQMAFVTIPSLEGEAIEDVANDIFRSFGVGQKGKDNGVLLLLVSGDRRFRLEIGHALEPILPDGLDGQILLDMRPALRAGQYGEALIQAAKRIGPILAQDKGVRIPSGLPQRQTREQPVHSIPWPLIGGGIFLLFLLLRGGGGRGGYGGGGGGNFLTGMLLGSLMSGGRRYGGGGGYGGGYGGFGGSDGGGGGFGGFGGGDSGGGGASSDW
jgi:uncharacterized protein